MASRWRPTLLLALIRVLALAATSEAYTLKVPRAAKANKPYAKGLCAAINEKGGGKDGDTASRSAPVAATGARPTGCAAASS